MSVYLSICMADISLKLFQTYGHIGKHSPHCLLEEGGQRMGFLLKLMISVFLYCLAVALWLTTLPSEAFHCEVGQSLQD